MNLIRVILGIAVLIGSVVIKSKAEPSNEEAMEAGATLLLWGREIAPSTLNLIVLAFALVGIAMIVLGVLGLAKQRR